MNVVYFVGNRDPSMAGLSDIERGTLADAANAARLTAQHSEDPSKSDSEESFTGLFDALTDVGVTAETEDGRFRIEHEQLKAWKAARNDAKLAGN